MFRRLIKPLLKKNSVMDEEVLLSQKEILKRVKKEIEEKELKLYNKINEMREVKEQ